MVKDCGFSTPEQMEEKTTGNGKNSPWKYPELYAPSAQEGCNLFQRNSNAPIFASFVRGTTPRPIFYYLPEVRSLFPTDVWRDPLRTYPDRDFVNELLHDINFGVRMGFNHDRTPFFSSNHRSANANPAPVEQELEREQKGRTFPCAYVFEFCLVSDGCYSKRALAAS